MTSHLKSLFVATTLLFVAAGHSTAGEMDSQLRDQLLQTADSGIRFLRETQAPDGSWSKSVGVTALALRAVLENPKSQDQGDGEFVARSVKFLLDHVNPDGSISETNTNRNYNTAVALVALKATGNSAHDQVIANAQAFLKGLQLDEDKGYGREHKFHGGIGYGGDERPDLSNIYMALEALKASQLDAADPTWEKALVFVSRSQNNSETNDLDFAANDGGFAYMPEYSPHGGSVSYGGMTHAGLLSLLFAGLDKSDPRVSAAYEWIRANYSVDTNPGAKNNQGYYYYLNAFAKSMHAYGEPMVVDSSGANHNWRNELAAKYISLQQSDGSWVNKDSPRWWEGDPNLCTAWTLIGINHIARL
jgi:squalene-hopene/tetraprenyl-beta-curcumene cyclase